MTSVWDQKTTIELLMNIIEEFRTPSLKSKKLPIKWSAISKKMTKTEESCRQYFSKLEKMHLKAASSSTATTDSTATTPKEALTTRKRKAVDNTINEDDEEILSNPVKKFKVKVEDDKPKKEEDEDEDVKPKKEEDEDEDEEEEDEEDQDSFYEA